MKILAFGASNSKNSINKTFAKYAAETYKSEINPDAEIEVIDLNDYELPLFSVDLEKEIGQPANAQAFLDKIAESDALIISFAEHNSNVSAAYKNLYDWASRIKPKVYQGKPAIYLSTSPGGRGGASALAISVNSAPFQGAEVKGELSVPSFYDNFDVEAGRLTNDDLQKSLLTELRKL